MKLNIALCITLFGSIYSHELFSCEEIDEPEAITTAEKIDRMKSIEAQLISQSDEKDLNPLKKSLYRSVAQHIHSRLKAVSLDRDIAGVKIDDEIAALRKDLGLLATKTVLEQKK